MNGNPYDLLNISPMGVSRSVERRLIIMERENGMLRQLKQFVEDQTDIETMIALSVFAKGLRTEFEAKNVPVPEWLDDRLRQIARAIDAQTRDAKELRLKEIAAEETRLLTAGEKREKLAAERAKLEAELQSK